MSQKKHQTGIRWKLLKLFAPLEVKNLIKYLNELTEDGSDIVIYKYGNYPITLKTSKNDQIDPISFHTREERLSFQLGVDYGVSILGGTTSNMSPEEFEILQEMDKKSTHGGGGGRSN